MASSPATEAANLARQHLRSGLVALQEIALTASGRRRSDLLEIAERAAMIMGVLFSIEREDALEDARTRRLAGVLAGLRRLLSELQEATQDDARIEQVSEGAAAAVAALFLQQRAAQPPPQAPAPREPPLRRTEREAERVELYVEVGLATDSNFYAGLAMDISTGGLFVSTYTLYAVGTPITLSFELPAGRQVLAYGEVRWVREPNSGDTSPGMGVAFTRIDPDDLAAVALFCKQRNPMYYEADCS
jgi:uncharacterized protein (TIGR02266 family)